MELSEALLHQVKEEAKNEFDKDHKKDIEIARIEAEEKARLVFEKENKAEVEKLKEQNEKFKLEGIKLQEEKQKLIVKEKEMEENAQKKLNEERQKIKETTEKEFSDQQRMKDREKETQIENLKKMLEEANRKASGVSQQVQGEVLEVDLEDFLKSVAGRNSKA